MTSTFEAVYTGGTTISNILAPQTYNYLKPPSGFKIYPVLYYRILDTGIEIDSVGIHLRLGFTKNMKDLTGLLIEFMYRDQSILNPKYLDMSTLSIGETKWLEIDDKLLFTPDTSEVPACKNCKPPSYIPIPPSGGGVIIMKDGGGNCTDTGNKVADPEYQLPPNYALILHIAYTPQNPAGAFMVMTETGSYWIDLPTVDIDGDGIIMALVPIVSLGEYVSVGLQVPEEGDCIAYYTTASYIRNAVRSLILRITHYTLSGQFTILYPIEVLCPYVKGALYLEGYEPPEPAGNIPQTKYEFFYL